MTPVPAVDGTFKVDYNSRGYADLAEKQRWRITRGHAADSICVTVRGVVLTRECL